MAKVDELVHDCDGSCCARLSNPTPGAVNPNCNCIRCHTSKEFQAFAVAFKLDLRRRWGHDMTDTHRAAIFLDPRFKKFQVGVCVHAPAIWCPCLYLTCCAGAVFGWRR